MKNLLRKSLVLIIAGIVIFFTSNVFGQSGNGLWQGKGPDTVFTNRNVKINNNMLIKGQIAVDSMRIKGSLHIGDSSIVVDPDILVGTMWTDRVSSNRLALNLMRRVSFWGSTFYTSNIRFGIGTQAPQHMLHLNWTPGIFSPTNQPVNMAFTNASTNATTTDGFLVGIAANGTAELKQQEAQDMQFYTAGSAANNSRMIIKGLAGATQGFVGIGNGFTLPRSHLHLNNNQPIITLPPNSVYTQFTNTGGTTGGTGSSAIDGFKIGIDASGNAHLIQQESNAGTGINSIPIFIDNTTQNFGTRQSMIITQDSTTGWPRIGIGNDPFLTTPRAHIHIGEDLVYQGGSLTGGYRDWMDLGMFILASNHYHATAPGRVDNMFVGLRPITETANPSLEKSEAIINWGNNPTTTPSHVDKLLFVFTSDSSTTPLKSSTLDGNEIARMITDGIDGKIGIGGDMTICGINPANSYSTGTGDPARTLEINSPAINGTPNPNIIHIPNLSLGLSTPNLSGGTGFSGLRFTDLTSNSTVRGCLKFISRNFIKHYSDH